jgi:hypothetical protein
MLRLLSAALLTLALVGFSSVAFAADDKKEVTLEGTIACAKCTFKADGQKACNIAIKVKDTIYFFDAASSKKYHGEFCMESKEGTVKGTVTEKDGKKYVAVTDLKAK